MKLLFRIICLTLIFLSINSCFDYKGRIINRAAKDARKGLITRSQYDSIVSTFYTIKKEDFSIDSGVVRTKGVYVCKRFEWDTINYFYSVIKLDTLGNLYFSQKLNSPPNNQTLKELYVIKTRYKILDNELLFETLEISSDLRTYNVIQYAKLNRDTLVFYKKINIWDGNRVGGFYIEPNEQFIYVDSLTENIKYPPDHPPVNNR